MELNYHWVLIIDQLGTPLSVLDSETDEDL